MKLLSVYRLIGWRERKFTFKREIAAACRFVDKNLCSKSSTVWTGLTKITEERKFKTLKICQANNQMGSLNPYNRIKSPLLKKSLPYLDWTKPVCMQALTEYVMHVRNTEMNSTHRLLESKKKAQM